MPAQRYKDYISRWKLDLHYFMEVINEGYHIKSDGCSGVPDFFLVVCVEHDIHYATHKDFYTGENITQEDADKYLKWGIQYHSWFGRWSPMAWWRYSALSSKKGMGLGEGPWASGPRRLEIRLAIATIHKKTLREPELEA